MQDVIAHLRVSSGVPRPTENKLDKKLPPLARAWTPLYVSLIPLMVTALGGDMHVELEAVVRDENEPRSSRGPASGSTLPWAADDVSAKGVEDGRGLLRVVEALAKVVGLEDAMTDLYSWQPKVCSGSREVVALSCMGVYRLDVHRCVHTDIHVHTYRSHMHVHEGTRMLALTNNHHWPLHTGAGQRRILGRS